MNACFWRKTLLHFLCFAVMALPTSLFAATQDKKTISPTVTHQIVKKAKQNNYWKVAFVTGKNGQVVFMNVSPRTNPKNEIGMETHPFDQIIIIAQGRGKAILAGKRFKVKVGDMIFIPQGTKHNVINLNANRPLKIISIYSNTDIPAGSKYKKKSDEH